MGREIFRFSVFKYALNTFKNQISFIKRVSKHIRLRLEDLPGIHGIQSQPCKKIKPFLTCVTLEMQCSGVYEKPTPSSQEGNAEVTVPAP